MAHSTRNWLWVLLSGLAVGWLIGLSLSPVLHIVVGSVIASTAAVVSVLAGINIPEPATVPNDREVEHPSDKGKASTTISVSKMIPRHSPRAVDAKPVALLLLGISAGSIIGIYARTNEWLGPNIDHMIIRWRKTGLDEKTISQRIFDDTYHPQTRVSESPKAGSSEKVADAMQGSQHAGGLYAYPVSDCEWVQARTGTVLASRLKTVKDKATQLIVSKCQSDEICLEALRDVICQNAR